MQLITIALQKCLEREISNEITCNENEIVVSLADGTKAKIKIKNVA
mgnify:CR=1